MQTQQLHDHLQKTTYFSTKEIRKYVKAKYGIIYSSSGMNFWLKAHGFVYKPPMKVPGRLNPEKQDIFIETYKALKATISKEEEIYFVDAVHPQFQSQAACGWIKKEEVKTLPTTSAQSRLHFIGALALQEMKILVEEYKTVNAKSMVEFCKKLERNSNATTIHIVCDNGPINKNKKVAQYLKTSRIKVHYLPPYSPNLNPTERLWKVLREKKSYNRFYEKFNSFKTAIREFFFEDIPKTKEELSKKLNDNFQRIKLNTININSISHS